MKSDELKAEQWLDYSGEPMPCYPKAKVDETIAELKDKCQMHDFFWEGCGFAKRGFKNTIAVSEAFDKLEAENAELKAKLENVQASAYAESVDAGMRERRLKRALWLARAERNKDLRTLSNFRKYVESHRAKEYSIYSYPTKGFPANYLHKAMMDAFETWCKYFKIAEDKCRAKAEEYK